MRVVISIAPHELEIAHRWFDWVIELGGTEGHRLHLIPAPGVNVRDIVPKADKAFHNQVTLILDYDAEISDWQKTDARRSAAGPNSSFRQVAWHFYQNKLGPFLWCELDCIPTREHWLDFLEAEYELALTRGKVFMGANVKIEGVPEHMSGNAVYPENIPEVANLLVIRTVWTNSEMPTDGVERELAFDVAGAPQVLPQAHFTNLIQHKFRYEGFKSREEFDAIIEPNAVMFHSDKNGTIFQYLRENLSGDVKSRHVPNVDRVEKENGPSGTPEEASSKKSVQPEPPDAEARPGQDTRGIPRSGSSAPPAQDLGGSLNAANIGGEMIPSPLPAQTISGEITSSTTFGSMQLHEAMANLYDMPTHLSQMSLPWTNRAESEHEVRLLCTALATFCKAPIYKSRVRQALRDAKIIK